MALGTGTVTITATNFGYLNLPGLRKIFGDAYSDYPEEYSQVFEIETSSKAFEEDHGISELGLAVEKLQGQKVSYDTVYDGRTKRYTHSTYGLGFTTTREMVEDDLYGKIKKMPKALARSIRHTIEIVAANHLNNAFSASYTGADAVSLCNAAHPLVNAGITMSNRPTVAGDLDITTYEQALIDIAQNWTDERGLKIMAKPKKLIIHPNDNFQAQMILKSSQLPDTPNNNINPAMNTMPGGMVMMHYLTDPDAWFIQTDIPECLKFFWRRRPEFTQDDEFDSENAKYKVTMRFSSGWTDFRGIYGNPGA